ncbi:hypothetical protein BJX96DRAFT_162871 [Aspergillus floccosus]
MSKLTDYALLCFDVYGTLIDWESGVLAAMQPTLDKNNAAFSRSELLNTYHELERTQQSATPDMPYSQLLTTIHPQFAAKLSLAPPAAEESRAFGESIGTWPAFPDTVDALHRLSKHFKLVVLSNVDRESFAKTNAGSLRGFPFDLIITAQDIGSYKPDLRNFEYMLRKAKETLGIESDRVLSTAQSQFHDHHPAHKVGLKSVAVTFTADQFKGIYRGKQYHAPDFADVLQRARENNCDKVMLTTMTLAGAKQNLQAVRKHPDTCTMTLGVHPYHAGEIYANSNDGHEHLQALREFAHSLLAENPSPLVAFGEIGLDYEYLDRADKDTQQRAFRDQLELAVELQLPLFLHVRSSCEDFISIIEPYLSRLPRGGLVHSFAGSRTEMLRLVELGFDISVNGVSFRSEEGLNMVRHIPLERLQLETDAPWCEVLVNDERIAPYLMDARALPPARKHNKFLPGQMVKTRNESCTIERVALVVARLKGVPVREVAEAAWNNSVRMFGLGVEK